MVMLIGGALGLSDPSASKTMKLKRMRTNQGFTIVELMIALSILSILLITSTVILIQISRWYSKGVNAASLQNVSRNVTSDITSALQFSGTSPTPISGPAAGSGIKWFCLGKVRYSYVEGRKLGVDTSPEPDITTNHVLWRDVMPSAATCNALDITVAGAVPGNEGYEMVGPNMRITSLSLAETPLASGIYTLSLSLAYGDQDLLSATTGWDVGCKGGPGSDFCSTSRQTSTITRRIK
jgi:prepilin-type N-terminal cleavage/methylation domain-containing protein